MRTIGFAAAAVACSAALAVRADAQTVTLRSLTPQSTVTQKVGTVTACSVPNANAAVDGTAFFEMPGIAALQGAEGTSDVKIELSPNGTLLSESILETSGNPNLDRAALTSAQMTKFAPEIRNCARVGGTYVYSVDF
jgi:TonB family protein